MKIRNTILFILLSICLTNCDNDRYLNIFPLTEVTEGSFYKNQTQLEQAVNDVYRQLGLMYYAHAIPDLFGEQLSDNTYILMKAGGDNFSEQISEFRILTDNGRIRSAWDKCYNAIFICNNVLDRINNSNLEIEDKVKNRMISEILVVRSLIYFNMVRAWGDVPLVLDVILPNESYNYTRTSSSLIYEQIIEDLIYAKNNLPDFYDANNIGRIHKYGAIGVLAKVYLTLGNKNDSKNQLKEIIDSGLFSLDANNDGKIDINDYKFLFLPNTKNSKETILEAQFKSGANSFNSNHQNVYSPFSHAFNLVDLGVSASIFRGEGINTPTNDLIEEYEQNDLRKDISIFNGFTNQATGDFVEYPFTIKFFDPLWTNPGKNFAIIRYADILLMYAEVTEDPTYLNMVRSRAELPLFNSAGYPNNKFPTLELAIEHERRVELSFEFHRFYDLKRTGRAFDVLANKGYNIKNNDFVFPIPQNVIDVNPIIIQNPGY